ncbi:hypothetical protein PoB_001253300 [Plakobranchus ocellatus]|uniref:Uncharacterized protein n=1 Tax=Plakobranchus ocellatus TaxID=259542 RepID=A0AAV3YU00_9GAST|nr:hypothetical protein PoB_001253300 [Plakobranchus ocellatus]
MGKQDPLKPLAANLLKNSTGKRFSIQTQLLTAKTPPHPIPETRNSAKCDDVLTTVPEVKATRQMKFLKG